MFRTMPADDLVKTDQVMNDELVPLSVLELDLPAPVEGWAAYLADRDIRIVLDDIGRAAVARSDARQLFDENREREVQAREHAAEVERQAIEADRQWRAQLNPGVSWYQISDGVAPAAAMLQAAHDAQPRQHSLFEEALSNSETLTFHTMTDEE